MIAVGYMDPGNGQQILQEAHNSGILLLSVILISNIFAMVLQHLSVKLGVVAERDLAQACRDHFKPTTNFILWVFCEIAIAACDLAEVIGSADCFKFAFWNPVNLGNCHYYNRRVNHLTHFRQKVLGGSKALSEV